MPSLLFEIGCEELPASACVEAEAQLRSVLADLGEGSVFVGPRRLVLLVDDLPEREPDEWVKGPPEHLRDKAAEGFARKQGLRVDDLEVRDGFLGVLVPGRPLLEALPERLNEIVRIVVETPKKLSARQRELLEEFARLSGEEVHPLSQSFLEKVKAMLG